MDALNDIIRLIDGYRENVRGLTEKLEHQKSLLAGLQWRRLQPGTVWKHQNKDRYAIVAYCFKDRDQRQYVRWFLLGDRSLHRVYGTSPVLVDDHPDRHAEGKLTC